ncbi:hypothetical protein J1N35_017060 [Gossypium stocksii]|uniref:Uncharacterized protein n=1 Tax=Gossypium stocksii TaxID=47602 RepID=A0A9D3VN97_9ROSI|nr:hypothetical protein J1N35_017060 [Gossypium stocksii]
MVVGFAMAALQLTLHFKMGYGWFSKKGIEIVDMFNQAEHRKIRPSFPPQQVGGNREMGPVTNIDKILFGKLSINTIVRRLFMDKIKRLNGPKQTITATATDFKVINGEWILA